MGAALSVATCVPPTQLTEMIQKPEAAAKDIAGFAGKHLNATSLASVVRKMGKDWAMEHVDPYHYRVVTRWAPPGAREASQSGFFVNSSKLPSKVRWHASDTQHDCSEAHQPVTNPSTLRCDTACPPSTLTR